MIKKVFLLFLVLLLSACNGGYIPLVINTPVASSTPQPRILSPTPPFNPSETPTLTASQIINTLTQTSSIIPTLTLTFTPTSSLTSTNTPTLSATLTVDILGCDTSLDILHQMGEVTNAYPVIRNQAGTPLTNVCATLSATDEARLHPDKTACLALLPAGYQVTFKLTVDTGVGQDTSIKVSVTSSEGSGASASRSSCREIGFPSWLSDKVGVVEPIQSE